MINHAGSPYLTSTHFEEQILGPVYDKAAERFNDDPDRNVAQTTIVDYLDSATK